MRDGSRTQQPGGFRLRRRSLGAQAGGILAASALLACGSSPNNKLLVTVTNLPTRATTLSVQAMLDGKPAMATMDITQPLDRFGVELPAGQSGHLALSLTALDTDRCIQGTASATVDLPASRIETPLAAAITAQTPRQCGNLTPCAAGTVCAISPKPQLNDINGLWVISPTDIWGVGDKQTMVHFDGKTWTPMSSATTVNLIAAWASGPSDVWAVGTAGAIQHYDGTKWSSSTSGAIYTLNAVWGVSPTDVWTVGANNGTGQGEFWHWDGISWKKIVTGYSGSFLAVWASSASDIFVTGSAGLILHWNGNAWAPMASGTSNSLYAVWGTAPNSVFAVGDFGTVLRYDGTPWKPISTGSTADVLYGVDGNGTNVFAVGSTGTVLRSSAALDSFSSFAKGTSADLLTLQVDKIGIAWVGGIGGYQGYFDTRP